MINTNHGNSELLNCTTPINEKLKKKLSVALMHKKTTDRNIVADDSENLERVILCNITNNTIK